MKQRKYICLVLRIYVLEITELVLQLGNYTMEGVVKETLKFSKLPMGLIGTEHCSGASGGEHCRLSSTSSEFRLLCVKSCLFST